MYIPLFPSKRRPTNYLSVLDHFLVFAFKGLRKRLPYDSKVPPSPLFLEQESLFLYLLISFIKPFKTSDFSKHVSHIMTWWYDTWKHSQTYYNEVHHIHKSLCIRYVRVNSIKRSSQTSITWVIRTIVILNYVKKSSHANYGKKFNTLITLWSCSSFEAHHTWDFALGWNYPCRLWGNFWK